MSKRAGLVLLGLLALSAAVGVRHWLVPLGTGDADEGAYAAEAELLQDGRVTLSADQGAFFRPWLTGERHGRVFFQYEPGWPAALAISDWLFGEKYLASALSAAGLVVAVYGLCVEALGDRRVALTASALGAASPLFLLHSALYLAYLFTALVATATLWAAFRAARRSSPWYAALVGCLLGVLLLTRPFDAVLTGLGAVLVMVVVGDRGIRRWVASVSAAGLALAPFVAVVLWFNSRTTGSALTFPLSASDPRNRFGFGSRGMQVGTAPIDYSVDVAFRALGRNLWAVGGWVFGGAITIVAAAWAVVRRGDRRPERLVLGAFALVFPAGYLFWWATAFSAGSATNALGPHYYVPAFVPLVILGADGIVQVARRDLRLAMGLGVLAVVLTAYNLPDKVNGTRAVSNEFRAVARAMPSDRAPSLVFIREDEPQSFTARIRPFLVNPPELDGPILYPVDRAGLNAQLLAQMPERRAYLVHRLLRPGGRDLETDWVRTLLRPVSGDPVHIRVEVTPPQRPIGLTAFAESDGHRVQRSVASTGAQTLSFPISGPDDSGNGERLALTPGPHVVRVGVSRGSDGERWQRAYDVYVRRDGSVTVLAPGLDEHVADFGRGPVTLREDVDHVVRDVP